MRLKLSALAHSIDGTLNGSDALFSGAGIDSRDVLIGQVFFALPGERVDGHAFLGQAQHNGAVASVINRNATVANKSSGMRYIEVDDTFGALLAAAKWWRQQWGHSVVALTGSSGKTTVKELLAAIFKTAYGDSQVVATRGNMNNTIGVPLTIFQLRAHHRIAILEMGASFPGEIELLADVAQANAALVTTVQAAHLSGFKNIDTIAKEKSAIYHALPEGGWAILPQDSEYVDTLTQAVPTHCRRLSFGAQATADVSAHLDENGHLNVRLPMGKTWHNAWALPGQHNVLNAACAISIAYAYGVSEFAISSALARCTSPAGRMELKRTKRGAKLWDDTYNANPGAVKQALNVLASESATRIAVLGDMAELGDESVFHHYDIGQHAKAQGIEYLYTFGKLSLGSTHAFGLHSHHFHHLEPLLHALAEHNRGGTVFLIKGSRSMHMERIVTALIEANNFEETL